MTSKDNDFGNYPWANNGTACFENEGFLNEVTPIWSGPGKAVTRGDFAMFMVKTLGLFGTPGSNFAVVDPVVVCAGENSLGKALGVLKSIGGNTFKTHGEFSRVGMMFCRLAAS